jgi:hypothetical protein
VAKLGKDQRFPTQNGDGMILANLSAFAAMRAQLIIHLRYPDTDFLALVEGWFNE